MVYQANNDLMLGRKKQKYPIPKRFPNDKRIRVPGLTLTNREVSNLLRGRVAVEEKMDGKSVSFLASGKFLIFAVDLERQRSVNYKVPGRFAVSDVFDVERGVYVFPTERTERVMALRKGDIIVEGIEPVQFFPVPQLEKGNFSMSELPDLIVDSAYSTDSMHGIVVRPDRDLFAVEFIAGEIVRPSGEEMEGVTRLPAELNAIDPTVEVVLRLSQGN